MDNALSINDVSVKVGGKNGREILKNMHFELKSGEICAILGANGSGKSTFLRAICCAAALCKTFFANRASSSSMVLPCKVCPLPNGGVYFCVKSAREGLREA